MSEEQCGQCDHTWQLDNLVENCPECGYEVVACHECQIWEDMKFNKCRGCVSGSKMVVRK